jgi:hypothetical protein
MNQEVGLAESRKNTYLSKTARKRVESTGDQVAGVGSRSSGSGVVGGH